MSNFIQKCLIGEALPADIDDYIDQWHESDSDLELHEYLGMSKKEYTLFVEDEDYLPLIITSHKEKTPIEEIFERIAMPIAARADNSAKSERLEKWLNDNSEWID